MSEINVNQILLNVANALDFVQTAQEEVLRCRQDLVNHRNETNPHGIVNPNSNMYKQLKNVVERILQDLANDGKIIVMQGQNPSPVTLMEEEGFAIPEDSMTNIVVEE